MFKRFITTPKLRVKNPFSFLTKRRKFIISVVLLSIGLFVVQKSPLQYKYFSLLGLVVSSSLLSVWSLKEDLVKLGWFMALILPTLFPAAVGSFYFLLPASIFSTGFLLVMFAISMYAILLIENIFAVASVRAIQLLRAAQALGFVLSLLSAFLMFGAIFSYRLEPWWNALFVMLFSLPLALQSVWSSRLDTKFNKDLGYYSFAVAWVVGQLAFFISFWPVTIIMASLMLVTALYIMLGIINQALVGRLFEKTIYDFVRVGVIVLLIILLTTKWG